MDSYIYLDNNATTIIPENVKKIMIKWCNMGNPSAEYATAKMCKKMMKLFKSEIATVCNFSLDEYLIIFNSGASESNNHILCATAWAYKKMTNTTPHFIISSVEHKSLMTCAKNLHDRGEIDLTIIPAKFKAITPEELRGAIKPNTALISIMWANNETGIINDVAALKAVEPKIPFHSDSVQYFGKLPIDISKTPIDAFSASFHKLHGPAGCGILVIKKSFISGYNMCPYICGTQNEGMRGGTENIIGIAGSFEAFRYSINNLSEKTIKVARLRAYLAKGLISKFKCCFIDSFNGEFIVFLAPANFIGTLPNTILLAINRPKICNRAVRAGLEANNIIVGLGSACGGSNILDIPDNLKSGVIRISLSSENSSSDIETFIEVFAKLIVSDSVLKVDQK